MIQAKIKLFNFPKLQASRVTCSPIRYAHPTASYAHSIIQISLAFNGSAHFCNYKWWWAPCKPDTQLVICQSESEMCPEHICYIIWDRNPKFSVWIHFGVAVSHTVSGVTVILTLSSDPSSRKIMSRAYILYCFKVGFPNLYCGYMLGCQSVTFWLGSLWTWPLAHLLYHWR